MNHQRKRTRLFAKLLLLIVFSLACNTVTLANSNTKSTNVGFDFVNQTPQFSEGDTSASLHLFLHKYHMPSDGFINGVTYLNDSDSIPESFDLLILRPDAKGWKVLYRVSLSDDSPPSQTGVTILTLPTSLPVQKNDVFAHWQNEAGGAIPMNGDDASFDGFSIGRYGFQSNEVDIGQYINRSGFTGQRDYFMNIIFSATP